MTKEKKTRDRKPEIGAAREARRFTGPLCQQINSWHARIAYLRGMGRAMHLRDDRRPQLLNEAEQLSQAVEAAQLSFRHEARTLPQHIILSPPMLDAARALDSVSVCLEQAISLISR